LTLYATPTPSRPWDKLLKTPFARLVRHCLARIFYGGDTAQEDELDLGVGVALGLLALPGVLVSFFLIDKYGSLFQVILGIKDFDPYAASMPDEYFFIALSMVVTASVVVWKWDSLLPDRRDYANLAPLPIHNRTFFAANLLALTFVTTIMSLDVNAASMVAFPLVVTGSRSSFSYYTVFLAAHVTSLLLASVFSFLVVLAILGTLMSVLPYRWFRKSSLYVRLGIVTFLLAILSTSFAVPPMIENLSTLSSSPLRFLPPVWFVALNQSMLARANPALLGLGRTALAATAIALVVAIGAYAFSYRRSFTRSAEIMESLPAGGGAIVPRVFRLLDWLLFRTPFERAGFRFTMKALARSDSQALVLGWFGGLGIVIASQTLFAALSARTQEVNHVPSAALLSIPLTLGYFLITGLRVAFDVPVALRANWLFRVTVDPDTHQCAPLVRKIMLLFLLPPLILICVPVYAHFRGWQLAVTHTAIVAATYLLLIEIFLMSFRKIPFTCSMPAFKSHSIATVVIFIIGFFVFSTLTSTAEQWALEDPFRFFFLAPLVPAAAFAIWKWRDGMIHLDKKIIFEDQLAPAVEVAMNLGIGP
jgi:hypothetical protein